MISRSWKVVLLAAALACGDSGLGPGNISVTSEPNSFQLQISGLDTVTDVASYGWVNDGTQARVDVSDFITAGAVNLTIRDADGNVVLQDNVANDNDTDTAVGTPGRWMIELELIEASGSFSLELDRLN